MLISTRKIDLEVGLKLSGDEKFAEILSKISQTHNMKVKADTQEAKASIFELYDFASTQLAKFGLAVEGLKKPYQIIEKAAKTFHNELIAPASEFEKYESQLVSLYKSVEKGSDVFNKFVEIASKTPYQLPDVMKAGIQLKAFGMDAENILKETADLATYMGYSMQEAASAWGRAFAGGVGAADIFREKGINALIKDFLKIKDLTKLTLPEWREAMIKTFTDVEAGVAGATDRLATKYVGIHSNLNDAMIKLKAHYGNKFLPFMKELESTVTKTVNMITEDSISKVKNSFNELDSISSLDKLSTELANLEKKSSLNNEEQERYNELIAEIGKLMPGAVLQYNEMGVAIKLNTSYLNDFISTQKSALLIRNRELINQTALEYQTLSDNINKAKKDAEALNNFNRSQLNIVKTPSEKPILSELDPNKGKSEEEIANQRIKTEGVLLGMIEDRNRAIQEQTEQTRLQQKMLITGLEAYVDFSKTNEEIALQLGLDINKDKDLLESIIGTYKRITDERKKLKDSDANTSSSVEWDDKDEKRYQTMLRKAKDEELKIEEAYQLGMKEIQRKYQGEDSADRLRDEMILYENYLSDIEALNKKKQSESEKITKEYLKPYEDNIAQMENMRKAGVASFDDVRAALEQYLQVLDEKGMSFSNEYAQTMEKIQVLDKKKIDDGLASYEMQIKKISIMRQAGLPVEKELLEALSAYIDALKKANKEDTDDYARAVEQKREITLNFGKYQRAMWQETHKFENAIYSSTTTGFKTAMDDMLLRGKSFKDGMTSLFESMKNSFIGSITEMTAEYIKKKMIEAAIHKTVEAGKQADLVTTGAVEASTKNASIFLSIRNASSKILEAIAGAVSNAITSGGIFGLLGMGAIGATILGLYSGFKDHLGFYFGGYSGSGNPHDIAGPIHKEEFAYTAKATKGNIKEHYTLMGALENGISLSSILKNGLQGKQFSYPTGGLKLGFSSGGYGGTGSFDVWAADMIRSIRSLEQTIIDSQPVIYNNGPDDITYWKKSQKGKKEQQEF